MPVAEDGAGTDRQHGREPAPLAAELCMTDGVDAVVQHQEAASGDAYVDHMRGNFALEQLGAGHDAVLAGGQLGDHAVPGGLTAHMSE